MSIEDNVLISASMHSEPYPFTPSNTAAGYAALLRSPFETYPLAEEWQSQRVLGPEDPAVCRLAVVADDAGEPYKSGVLDEPRNEWMSYRNVPFKKPVQCELHCSKLGLEVPNRDLSRPCRLRVLGCRALCRRKI